MPSPSDLLRRILVQSSTWAGSKQNTELSRWYSFHVQPRDFALMYDVLWHRSRGRIPEIGRICGLGYSLARILTTRITVTAKSRGSSLLCAYVQVGSWHEGADRSSQISLLRSRPRSVQFGSSACKSWCVPGLASPAARLARLTLR